MYAAGLFSVRSFTLSEATGKEKSEREVWMLLYVEQCVKETPASLLYVCTAVTRGGTR